MVRTAFIDFCFQPYGDNISFQILEKGEAYCFYQSSYDNDEKGTILSVTHDGPGIFVTYTGYFLLSLGMFLSLFNKKSRLYFLSNTNIKKTASPVFNKSIPVLMLLFFLSGDFANGQDVNIRENQIISKTHANQFGSLLIQDKGGRIKPINTFTSDILRKLTGKENIYRLDPNQVYLGMLSNPYFWQGVPLIKVSNPEITNLVPVLKSYWLTFHVSIITASYSFLALAAILGFLNLILYLLQTQKKHKTIKIKISELTGIAEKAMIVGVYLLTLGTVLGAIWANESWGRYWGWDPKETWTLISIIVYTFILHMRFVPGLKTTFTFNLASLLGFSSILMTYFGVNYYLSRLHSYAGGDPVPIPSLVYYNQRKYEDSR